MRRYHIQDREDYHKYNKLCGQLRSLVHRLSLLPAGDPVRARREGEMLDKLYDMGVLGECAGDRREREYRAAGKKFPRARRRAREKPSERSEITSAAGKEIPRPS